MSDKKNKMVVPRDGVMEHGYHPPKEKDPPKNPPKGGMTISSPTVAKEPKK